MLQHPEPVFHARTTRTRFDFGLFNASERAGAGVRSVMKESGIVMSITLYLL